MERDFGHEYGRTGFKLTGQGEMGYWEGIPRAAVAAHGSLEVSKALGYWRVSLPMAGIFKAHPTQTILEFGMLSLLLKGSQVALGFLGANTHD